MKLHPVEMSFIYERQSRRKQRIEAGDGELGRLYETYLLAQELLQEARDRLTSAVWEALHETGEWRDHQLAQEALLRHENGGKLPEGYGSELPILVDEAERRQRERQSRIAGGDTILGELLEASQAAFAQVQLQQARLAEEAEVLLRTGYENQFFERTRAALRAREDYLDRKEAETQKLQ